jgi:hypothetical protein
MLFESEETAVVEFIEKFGAYLDLYQALNAASDQFSKKVIQKLLDLASHDPVHIDCMKLFSRTGNFIPYEAKVLSCLLTRLPSLVKEGKGRSQLLTMIVTMYPDLKPWQIRSMVLCFDLHCCEILNSENLRNAKMDDVIFYYEYLSLLMESSHMARSDKSLVEEWCFMSTSEDFDWDKSKRRQNFFKVASTEERENKLTYIRDLSYLIETSFMIKEYSLTLNLADEIISKCKSQSDHDILIKAISILQNVSRECLNSNSKDKTSMFDTVLMRQILLLFNNIASSSIKVFKDSVDICAELGTLLDQCQQQSTNMIEKEELMITLMSETMSSDNTLTTLSSRSLNNLSSSSIVSALQTCLKKGTEEREDNEISSALLRLRKVRPSIQTSRSKCNAPGIWESMQRGTALIDK